MRVSIVLEAAEESGDELEIRGIRDGRGGGIRRDMSAQSLDCREASSRVLNASASVRRWQAMSDV
jgi:hypothetical protein